jgi:hypothetical protein
MADPLPQSNLCPILIGRDPQIEFELGGMGAQPAYCRLTILNLGRKDRVLAQTVVEGGYSDTIPC